MYFSLKELVFFIARFVFGSVSVLFHYIFFDGFEQMKNHLKQGKPELWTINNWTFWPKRIMETSEKRMGIHVSIARDRSIYIYMLGNSQRFIWTMWWCRFDIFNFQDCFWFHRNVPVRRWEHFYARWNFPWIRHGYRHSPTTGFLRKNWSRKSLESQPPFKQLKKKCCFLLDDDNWLVISTHLKNMLVQLGSSSPIFGVKIKHIWVATT